MPRVVHFEIHADDVEETKTFYEFGLMQADPEAQ